MDLSFNPLFYCRCVREIVYFPIDDADEYQLLCAHCGKESDLCKCKFIVVEETIER